MTVKEMFELPEPQKRDALAKAVGSRVLNAYSIEDIQYRMASAEERATDSIPVLTADQILTTHILYKCAYLYKNDIDGPKDRPMKCSICDEEIEVVNGWSEGHNAQPVNDGRCCGDCNWMVVVPRRLGMFGLDDQDAGALAEAFRANEGGSGD